MGRHKRPTAGLCGHLFSPVRVLLAAAPLEAVEVLVWNDEWWAVLFCLTKCPVGHPGKMVMAVPGWPGIDQEGSAGLHRLLQPVRTSYPLSRLTGSLVVPRAGGGTSLHRLPLPAGRLLGVYGTVPLIHWIVDGRPSLGCV